MSNLNEKTWTALMYATGVYISELEEEGFEGNYADKATNQRRKEDHRSAKKALAWLQSVGEKRGYLVEG